MTLQNSPRAAGQGSRGHKTRNEALASPALPEEPRQVSDGTRDEVVSAIANRLTDHDLNIRSPQWEDSHYFKITNTPGVMSDLTISDIGFVEWEYRLCDAGRAHPAHFADLVTGLLGGAGEHCGGPARRYPDLTLRSTVVRVLTQRGMRALVPSVYRDDVIGEVYSEIEVTNPARPARGRVLLADDNSVRWECHVSGIAAGGIQGIGPEEIAETIARALIAGHEG